MALLRHSLAFVSDRLRLREALIGGLGLFFVFGAVLALHIDEQVAPAWSRFAEKLAHVKMAVMARGAHLSG